VNLPPPEAAREHVAAWASYASNGKWECPKHLRYLSNLLMEVESGKTLRLAISCPPRHGKSWLVSRYFPSWWLGRHPEHKVILVSMQERFSRRWGRMARDDFVAHGEKLFGVTTWSRASTAEWEVYRGPRRTEGSMSAVGAGGTITGKGADIMLIDDLIKDLAEARNDSLREAQREWVQSAIETRLEPPGRVVVISTRWHHDDLIGWLMAQQKAGELGDEWKFVNLPAIAEDGDALGRAKGEALWPEKRPLDWLERKKKNVGPYVWSSLYQGQPTPTEGAIFKADWFKRYKREGELLRCERGVCKADELIRFGVVDLAASKKKRADYTVLGAFGYHPGWRVLFLLDLVRERFAGPEYVPRMKGFAETHKLGIMYVEREHALIQEKLGFSVVKEAIAAGVPIVEIKPDGDKVARAIASTGSFAAGQVFTPEGAPFLGDLDLEMLTFPEAKHDDQVDVMSYAVGLFRELVATEPEEKPKKPPREDEPPPPDGWDLGMRSDRPWWT
jgi:predicted phage terminase large subunit-like protein